HGVGEQEIGSGLKSRKQRRGERRKPARPSSIGGRLPPPPPRPFFLCLLSLSLPPPPPPPALPCALAGPPPLSAPARDPARQAVVWTTFAGSFRLPRKGTGDRYGLSVSTSRRFSGTVAATRRRSAAFLYVSIPAKDRYSPIATPASAIAALPVKECSTPRI